jgi:hypothetical protein
VVARHRSERPALLKSSPALLNCAIPSVIVSTKTCIQQNREAEYTRPAGGVECLASIERIFGPLRPQVTHREAHCGSHDLQRLTSRYGS